MMRRVLLAALACVAMGGIVAAELADDLGGDEIELPAARVADTAPSATAAPAGLDTAVQDILARPVFTPNRQPSAARSGKAQAAEPFKRRLTGVAIGPSTREAVFAGEGRDKPAIVVEGQAIEGWTVETVAAGAVTVRAGSASQQIEITKAKPGGAAAKQEQRADYNSSSTGASLIRRDR